MSGTLLDRLQYDQCRRWRDGVPRTVEDYLCETPALQHEPDVVTFLAFNEYRLREELGEAPPIEPYLQRFDKYGCSSDWPKCLSYMEASKRMTFSTILTKPILSQNPRDPIGHRLPGTMCYANWARVGWAASIKHVKTIWDVMLRSSSSVMDRTPDVSAKRQRPLRSLSTRVL